MGQTGTEIQGSERKAASPSGLGRAGPWRGPRAQREGRQLARGRRECSSAPQPRAQQKLQAGVRQPPRPGLAGGSARSLGTWLRGSRSRPSISRSPLPARSLLGRRCQALLFGVCLLFIAVLARAGQRPGGGGTGVGGAPPEFPTRERVRGSPWLSFPSPVLPSQNLAFPQKEEGEKNDQIPGKSDLLFCFLK